MQRVKNPLQKSLTNNKNFAIINIENERGDNKMIIVVFWSVTFLVLGIAMILLDIYEATTKARKIKRASWIKRHPQYYEDKEGNLIKRRQRNGYAHDF